MAESTFIISEDVAGAVAPSPAEASALVLLAAAVKLFEVGRLSSGKAGTLAGLPRVAFLTKLAEFNVPASCLTEEEFLEDLSRARCVER
jgi:predicted HTH domain antitoxin